MGILISLKKFRRFREPLIANYSSDQAQCFMETTSLA